MHFLMLFCMAVWIYVYKMAIGTFHPDNHRPFYFLIHFVCHLDVGKRLNKSIEQIYFSCLVFAPLSLSFSFFFFHFQLLNCRDSDAFNPVAAMHVNYMYDFARITIFFHSLRLYFIAFFVETVLNQIVLAFALYMCTFIIH